MSGSILANNDGPTILFAIASIAAGIIGFLCTTPPNPKPAHAEKDDFLFNGQRSLFVFLATSGAFIAGHVFIAIGILAAIVSLEFDHAGAGTALVGGGGRDGSVAAEAGVDIRRVVCPHYENLDARFVQAGSFSIACLGVGIAGGLLRLEAFRELGRNFTFELARPSSLTTRGLYAWVQHPSYTGGVAYVTAMFLLWVQPGGGGVVGCFVPVGMAESVWMGWGVRGLFLSLLGWGLKGRVREEERMLAREFGARWIEYHERTARFIPGVV